MKKIFFVFITVISFFSLDAQIFYDKTVNKFEISSMRPDKALLSNAANNEPGTIPKTPSCAFVLEYGNGYFTTQNNKNNNEYHYFKANHVNSVLTLSARYDTIKPPAVYSAFFDVTASGPVTPQSLLKDGEYIRLTPIARSINVKDEMLFILTYKKPPQMAAGKLMLFYNSLGASAFIPVASVDAKIAESLGAYNKSGTVLRVRTHFKEDFTIPNLPATMRSATPS